MPRRRAAIFFEAAARVYLSFSGALSCVRVKAADGGKVRAQLKHRT